MVGRGELAANSGDLSSKILQENQLVVGLSASGVLQADSMQSTET